MLLIKVLHFIILFILCISLLYLLITIRNVSCVWLRVMLFLLVCFLKYAIYVIIYYLNISSYKIFSLITVIYVFWESLLALNNVKTHNVLNGKGKLLLNLYYINTL